ncbi:MAG: hypothetical protein NTX64_11950, partial [Elusimicrobia bacterium]|nr:hypothetical protein [Elusimicrobiota bacterium]
MLLTATSALAQTTPGLISFQGRLTDSSNNPLNANTTLTFAIFDHPTNGTHTACPGPDCLWIETQTGVAVVNGVLSVQLGAVTPIPSAVFAAPSAYLEVTVGPVSSVATLTPRERLVTVPYAANAALLGGQQASTFLNVSDVGKYGLTISSAVFTSTGAAGYALVVQTGGIWLQAGNIVLDTGKITLAHGLVIDGRTGNIAAGGSVTAATFFGDGSNLQNINVTADSPLHPGEIWIGDVNDEAQEVKVSLNDFAYAVGGSSLTIAAGAVSSAKIAADAVLTAAILNGAVQTSKLAADAVTNASLLGGAVQTSKLAKDAVTNTAILNGTIALQKIDATGCSGKFMTSADGSSWSCGNPTVGANAIDTDKLAADAVDSTKILYGAVNTSKLAKDAVITLAIMDGNVQTSKLAKDAVTTLAILGGAVQTSKLAKDAVTNTAILNGTIALQKIDATGCSGKFMTSADGSSWSCGNPTVSANAIDTGKLAADAVDSTKILNGSIDTTKLVQSF